MIESFEHQTKPRMYIRGFSFLSMVRGYSDKILRLHRIHPGRAQIWRTTSLTISFHSLLK